MQADIVINIFILYICSERDLSKDMELQRRKSAIFEEMISNNLS